MNRSSSIRLKRSFNKRRDETKEVKTQRGRRHQRESYHPSLRNSNNNVHPQPNGSNPVKMRHSSSSSSSISPKPSSSSCQDRVIKPNSSSSTATVTATATAATTKTTCSYPVWMVPPSISTKPLSQRQEDSTNQKPSMSYHPPPRDVDPPSRQPQLLPEPPKTPPSNLYSSFSSRRCGTKRMLLSPLSPPVPHRVTSNPTRGGGGGGGGGTRHDVRPSVALQSYHHAQNKSSSSKHGIAVITSMHRHHNNNMASSTTTTSSHNHHHHHQQQHLSSTSCLSFFPSTNCHLLPPHERIGDSSLGVYKMKLLPWMIPLLDKIVWNAEKYAASLPNGWRTDLYSLTKQDLALMDIPNDANKSAKVLPQLVRPIFHYLKSSISILYGAKTVQVDKNQPHILKYSIDSGHTGVELHHDRCDITANLVLSRSDTYKGGGTFIPDIGQVIRLEHGEFLLHPGSLVHGGMDVTSGTRYLMVMFAHLK